MTPQLDQSTHVDDSTSYVLPNHPTKDGYMDLKQKADGQHQQAIPATSTIDAQHALCNLRISSGERFATLPTDERIPKTLTPQPDTLQAGTLGVRQMEAETPHAHRNESVEVFTTGNVENLTHTPMPAQYLEPHSILDIQRNGSDSSRLTSVKDTVSVGEEAAGRGETIKPQYPRLRYGLPALASHIHLQINLLLRVISQHRSVARHIRSTIASINYFHEELLQTATLGTREHQKIKQELSRITTILEHASPSTVRTLVNLQLVLPLTPEDAHELRLQRHFERGYRFHDDMFQQNHPEHPLEPTQLREVDHGYVFPCADPRQSSEHTLNPDAPYYDEYNFDPDIDPYIDEPCAHDDAEDPDTHYDIDGDLDHDES